LVRFGFADLIGLLGRIVFLLKAAFDLSQTSHDSGRV
jgi:hypothetical protein